MGDFPRPPTPADCDLRDFPSLPVDIVRLFGSNFHATAKDSEWRAGVTLWMKSFHQVPAASLPEDDAELTMLADLGRDQKTWKKLKAKALQGWFKCSDGRLYHKVVAEKALIAWIDKLVQRKSSAAGNAKRWNLPFDAVQFDRALDEAADQLTAINPSAALLKKRVLKGYGQASRQSSGGTDAGSQTDAVGTPTGNPGGIAVGSPTGISTGSPGGIAREGKVEAKGKNLSPIHGSEDLSDRGARGVGAADWDDVAPFGRTDPGQDDGDDERYPDMDEVPEPEASMLTIEPSPAPRARHKAQPKHVWPPDAWDRFWQQYPEKVGKKAAGISFDRLRNSGAVPFEHVMAGLHRYMTTKPPTRAWCHPATWLNGARWDDQPDSHQQNSSFGARNDRANALNAAFDALYEAADREENSGLQQHFGRLHGGIGRDPAGDRDEQLL